jgi:hypothetical protein
MGNCSGGSKMYKKKTKGTKVRKAAADFNSIPIVTSPFLLPGISSNPYTRFRMCWEVENTDLEILKDLHILSTLNIEKLLEFRLCVWMDIRLALLDSWTDFIHVRDSVGYLSQPGDRSIWIFQFQGEGLNKIAQAAASGNNDAFAREVVKSVFLNNNISSLSCFIPCYFCSCYFFCEIYISLESSQVFRGLLCLWDCFPFFYAWSYNTTLNCVSGFGSIESYSEMDSCGT